MSPKSAKLHLHYFSRQGLTRDKTSTSPWSSLSSLSYPESPQSDGPPRAILNWDTKGRSGTDDMTSSSFVCSFSLCSHLPVLSYIASTVSHCTSLISGMKLTALWLGCIFIHNLGMDDSGYRWWITHWWFSSHWLMDLTDPTWQPQRHHACLLCWVKP